MSEILDGDVDAAPRPKPTVTSGPPEEPVARHLDGQVAYLAMQYRPHNFMNAELVGALVDGARWAQEQGARAVVVKSNLRTFCAGADLALFESAQQGSAPEDDMTSILECFDSLPIPIIASVSGVCVGGGLEIALACDLVIAAESAKIGSVEAALGVNPLMGAMQRVTQRAGAARAKEMALLARRYDARTLEQWNIINWVVPDEQLAAATDTLAQELAHGPTVAHASSKAIISLAASEGIRATDAAMGELQKGIWASEDLKEGLRSLVVNGPGAARFEGK